MHKQVFSWLVHLKLGYNTTCLAALGIAKFALSSKRQKKAHVAPFFEYHENCH